MPVYSCSILAFAVSAILCVSGFARAEEFKITDEARRHWAFQPVRNVSPPVVDAPWAKTDVDRFLLGPLQAKGLQPNSPADKRTLIRRATFDLTGLPPTPQEIEAFLTDESSSAFEKVVERLLASRAYGEKWGRHWLDVVRYADTAGDGSDYPIREAYKYRNWVIDAFNNDKPYDEFLREQIAGDIYAREGPPELLRDRVIATGYLAITKRFGHDLKEEYRHLDLADTIEVVGRSLLGLSIGCARCHDHKYDPVSMADYYGLYGIFNSTQYAYPGGEQLKKPLRFVPLVPRAEQERVEAKHKKALDAADQRLKDVTAQRDRLYADSDGRGGPDLAFELQDAEKPPRFAFERIGPKVVISTDAQSPYTNVYPRGTRGVRIPAEADGQHGFRQNIVPAITPETRKVLLVNFDLRNLDAPDKSGSYRIFLGQRELPSAAIEVHVSGDRVWVSNGAGFDEIRGLQSGAWYNVQLTLNLVDRTYAGSVGRPGDWTSFQGKSLRPNWIGTINVLLVDTLGHLPGMRPAHEFDNFAFADARFDTPLSADYRPVSPAEDRHAAKREELPKLQENLAAAQTERDAMERTPLYEVAYAVVEGDKPANVKIHKRGEPSSPGEEVPRRFLEILGGDPVPTEEKGSGRRQLAEWVTRPSNPLTARVMVNRVWQWHFGKGIVRTASDFGLRGEPPTHPELLDYLASRFMAEGWSVKKLHRLLMLSNAYQMSSAEHPAALQIDPENKLLSRFPRRRLLAEEVRDAMLAIAGTLDPSPGDQHPFPPVEKWDFTTANIFYGVYPSNRRSVYLMVQRARPHPFLSLWDSADPNFSIEDRPETITPKQALYLMNDPFVHEQSVALAKRLATVADEAARVRLAWELAVGRPPTSEEAAEAEAFLSVYRERFASIGNANDAQQLTAWSAYARALMTSNGFLYVD